MKKNLLIAAVVAMALNTNAAIAGKPTAAEPDPQPTWTEWNDQQVNAVNRYRLHTQFFGYENETLEIPLGAQCRPPPH